MNGNHSRKETLAPKETSNKFEWRTVVDQKNVFRWVILGATVKLLFRLMINFRLCRGGRRRGVLTPV